jgi:hypothetical protein
MEKPQEAAAEAGELPAHKATNMGMDRVGTPSTDYTARGSRVDPQRRGMREGKDGAAECAHGHARDRNCNYGCGAYVPANRKPQCACVNVRAHKSRALPVALFFQRKLSSVPFLFSFFRAKRAHKI